MTTAATTTPSKRLWRPWRFSLSALLVAVTLLCIGAARFVAPYRTQPRIIARVEQLGGHVATEPGGPEWLRLLAGNVFVQIVKEVSLRPAKQGTELLPLTDDDVALLAQAHSLRSLDLGHRAFTDAHAEQLQTLQSLEHLDLAYTQITDAGVRHLAALSQLRRLRLHGTAVTDAALDDLARLSALELLDLHGTRVTRAGVARIARGAALPEVRCVQVRLEQFVPYVNWPEDRRKAWHSTPVAWARFAAENLGEVTIEGIWWGRGVIFMHGRAERYYWTARHSDMKRTIFPGDGQRLEEPLWFVTDGAPCRLGLALDDWSGYPFVAEDSVVSDEFTVPREALSPQDAP